MVRRYKVLQFWLCNIQYIACKNCFECVRWEAGERGERTVKTYPSLKSLSPEEMRIPSVQVPLVRGRNAVPSRAKGAGTVVPLCVQESEGTGSWGLASLCHFSYHRNNSFYICTHINDHWFISVPRLKNSNSCDILLNWRRKWQPTPVFLPRESQGRGSLVGCCLWGRTELDTTDGT